MDIEHQMAVFDAATGLRYQVDLGVGGHQIENLDITEARLQELGLEGFMPPIKVTCEDHSGGHPVYVQQWDGATWQKATDWFEPMTDVVRPMLEEAAAEYVKANQPWPERAEPCD